MQGELIAALDLGSGGVTVAVGALDEAGKLELREVVWQPMRGVSRGEIVNRQQVSDAVRKVVTLLEERLGTRISELYTGTAGRHVRWATHDWEVEGKSADGDIRAEDVELLREAMQGAAGGSEWRILERIPQRWTVDGNDAVDPVGAFGRRLSSTFGFVLASDALLERLEKTLTALGVHSRRTMAGAVAAAEAVVLPDEREMGVAVVDLGAGATDVCVVADGAIRFVRSIPFGSHDIDNDIHQQGILEKHVEDLKTTYGLAMVEQVHSDKLIRIPGRTPRESQEISQRNLATIIEHRLREIIKFVGEEIAESGYSGKLRGGIVLTGGGSQLAGVDELFREMLGMDVRLALPDVRVSEGCVELAQNPARATVIGLLLKGLEGGEPVREGYVAPKPILRQQDAMPTVPEGEQEEERSPRLEKNKEKDKGEKKQRRGSLKNWFDGFFSETLDGDEDL